MYDSNEYDDDLNYNAKYSGYCSITMQITELNEREDINLFML